MAIGAGLVTGSVSLIGFGADSFIEVISVVALLWRLRKADPHAEERGASERRALHLVWGWMRNDKPLLWALLGAAVLAAYGLVTALQPITEFGRVYAAYGGIFIALAWGIIVDGFRPDSWDLLGAASASSAWW